MSAPSLISVVSPVYGAQLIIDELVRRTVSVLTELGTDYEIILIDDCGPDKSWERIKALCAANPKVKGYRLSRNFGQHFAITAGIEQAKGDYVVVIDCDLQDDPEYIKQMYEKAKEGYDIIYTVKQERKHSFFKNVTASLFNTLFNYLVDNKSYHGHSGIGAYSMISRKVADAFISFNDYNRHYLMVLRWLGFKSYYLPVIHRERFAGKSSYNLSKLIHHALNGITSQSDKLLRIFITLGLGVSLLAFCSIILIVILYFVQGFLSGWASLIVVMLFSTGIILTGIGVLGLYLGKTYEQTKNRPKYIIDERINA